MDRYAGVDHLDIDPDKTVILAGVVISLVSVPEPYSAWRQARNDSYGPSVPGDDRSAAEE